MAIALVAGVLVASNGMVSAFDDTVPWAQRPVTVGTGFVLGNGPAVGRPVVSQSGQWVAFASAASNLVPGDTNGQVDLFLRDRFHDVTIRIVENVETAVAMSADGRYIAFTAPGDLLSDRQGTTRDGIWDTKTGEFIAAAGVTAINNDGWFTTIGGRVGAELADAITGSQPVKGMSRLNDDGSITGPYDIHRPRTTEDNSGIFTGDPSLRIGAYMARVPFGSPYYGEFGGGLVPVWVDMVTGDERSILDVGVDPAIGLLGDNSGVDMSPNGRYTTYRYETIDGSVMRRFWDTQTNKIVFDIPLWEALPTNDGRLIAIESNTLTVVDPADYRARRAIAPFEGDMGVMVGTRLYGFATDPNRVLSCAVSPLSRFDTNGVRDCYLVQIPPK